MIVLLSLFETEWWYAQHNDNETHEKQHRHQCWPRCRMIDCQAAAHVEHHLEHSEQRLQRIDPVVEHESKVIAKG